MSVSKGYYEVVENILSPMNRNGNPITRSNSQIIILRFCNKTSLSNAIELDYRRLTCPRDSTKARRFVILYRCNEMAVVLAAMPKPVPSCNFAAIGKLSIVI